MMAAGRYGASEIIDPRLNAAGSIRDVYARYRHIANVLPAMGNYPEQMRDPEIAILMNADRDL